MVSLSPKGISYGARTIGTEHFDKLSANGKYKQTYVYVLTFKNQIILYRKLK